MSNLLPSGASPRGRSPESKPAPPVASTDPVKQSASPVSHEAEHTKHTTPHVGEVSSRGRTTIPDVALPQAASTGEQDSPDPSTETEIFRRDTTQPASQAETAESAPSPSTDLVVREEVVEGEVVELFPGLKRFEPGDDTYAIDVSGKPRSPEATRHIDEIIEPIRPATIEGETDDPPPSRRAIPADEPTDKKKPIRGRVPHPETPTPTDANEPVENPTADQPEIQVYSRPTEPSQATDHEEETHVLDEVVKLRKAWDRERGELDRYTDTERREYFEEDLTDNKSAIVLTKDPLTGETVGFGTLTEIGEGTGELSQAYVKDQYRGEGRFGRIVDQLLTIADERGYESVLAYPASDNIARRVLEEEKGFVVQEGTREEGEGNVTLIKYLGPQTDTPTQPRSEPTSLSAAYQPEKSTFPLPTPPSNIEFREIPEEVESHIEHSLPIVVQAGKDISVIGTNHWSIPPENMTLPENFTNAIAAAKHIILEGSPFVYEGTYEAIAVTTAAKGKKSIRFLESEAGDPVRALETSGMPPQIAAFVKMYPNLMLGISEIYDNQSRSYQDSLADTIAWLIPTSRAISPYFSERTDEQLTNLFSGWIRGMERHLAQRGGSEGFNVAEIYEAKIRESKMFSAENMAALQRLPGRKTIIVGRAHATTILRALEGRYPQRPSRWKTYVRGLSQNEKDAVGDLYDLAYP